MASSMAIRPAGPLSRLPAKRCVCILSQARQLSTQSRSQSTLSASSSTSLPEISPLSVVPTPHLLRGLMITSVTTAPAISDFLSKQLVKHSAALDKNPVTNSAIRLGLYNHFCAGSKKEEIQATCNMLKKLGYDGVALTYAKEVEKNNDGVEDAATSEEMIKTWLDGTLKTIEYTNSGEYVAVKYTGAGETTCARLEDNGTLPSSFMSGLDDICQSARTKGIRLLFDAEHTSMQNVIDDLTMNLMAKYNTPGQIPIVYNTYQMYLKSSPATLKKHVESSNKSNFTFAAKVVRGAYLHSDPRHLIHDTKADTDAAYDSAVTYLLSQSTPVGLVIATHNRESVDHTRAVLTKMPEAAKHDIAFAQLMGMADEISLDLVAKNKIAAQEGAKKIDVIKYLPWGSVEECIKYLLRRADENKDALSRTAESRDAIWKEICRRGGMSKAPPLPAKI